jgi:hypothetical protein
MPRKLLIVNVFLLVIATGSAAFILRQLTAPLPMPTASRRPPASASAPAPAEETPRAVGAGAYAAVAARNLFSPTRTEAPASPTTTASASPALKPNLYGIVLREGAPIAYLEDPATKRVAGYRIGDNVAGGTVQTISADSVVINRPDGRVDVRLRDPSRPRPAPVPAAATGVPGAQPAGIQPPLPGVIPPAGVPGVRGPGQVATPPGVAPPPGGVPQPGVVPQPGAAGQPTPPIMRRPLPPNLLRRLPQLAPPDASRQ